MSRTTRRALMGALLAAAAAGVLSLHDDASPETTATEHLVDRLWVARMPQDDRDMVTKLALVRSIDHGPFGVHEHGSVWRHRTEIFKWRLDGDQLHTVWPQSRQRSTVRVSTRECEGQAPEPFELCLDVTVDDGRIVTLYSRHQWVVRPRREGDDLVEDPIIAEALAAISREDAPLPAEISADSLTPGGWPEG